MTEKTVDVIGIRNQIVGLEGEHADHLTTTTAQLYVFYLRAYFLDLNLELMS